MLPSADTGNERESRRSGWRRHLARAASLLLVFTLGWTAYLGVFPGFGTTQAQHFRTGVGQTTTVTLPEGSVVTLDAETEMRLRETPGERRVELVAGRAFFCVPPDPSRPLLLNPSRHTGPAIHPAS